MKTNQCRTEDDCPTPMWCRGKNRCPKRDVKEQASGPLNAADCSQLDAARLQWILDHVTDLECTENVAGNLEKFTMPATRKDIDREMRGRLQ